MKKYFLLLLLAPFAAWGQPSGPGGVPDEVNTQLLKFNQFYRSLVSSYVDSVDYAKIAETAIRNALSELDPHSSYLSADEMKQVQQSFEGNFSGIGIEFNILNDSLFVVNTIPGGPSEKVGLIPNDRIVAVDGRSMIGVKQTEVPKYLRGPKGTEINVEVVRHEAPEKLVFRIVRDDIPITTIDASYLVDESTGYIKVNRFANNTMKEFNEAFDKLGKIDALILDLRGNGGGLMNEGLDMANFFLPKGSLLLTTEGKSVRPERFSAERDGKFLKGKVVVLVDEYSASASEIVAGTLQDWDRAVIVGRRSFGKGLVQRQYPLIDGSAVRITVSRYHTPTGRMIQRPYENGKSGKYYEDLAQRIKSADDNPASGSAPSFSTLKLGKTVYGGGGVYPDHYVASDTTGYSEYWAKLVRMGVINEFISVWLDNNRSSTETVYPDFGKFEKNFSVTQVMIDELVSLGEKRSVPFDSEGLAESRERMETQLKALIAQKLWSTTEYYRVINAGRDEIFKGAREVIFTWDNSARGVATDGA